MSDTPRTDEMMKFAQPVSWQASYGRAVDLCRRLERELTMALSSRAQAAAIAENTKFRVALESIVEGDYALGADAAHPAIALARKTLNPNPRPERHYPR